MVTLKFTDALTVFDGASMALAGDFSATKGDTLTLASDGSSWYEVGRSSNCLVLVILNPGLWSLYLHLDWECYSTVCIAIYLFNYFIF